MNPLELVDYSLVVGVWCLVFGVVCLFVCLNGEASKNKNTQLPRESSQLPRK